MGDVGATSVILAGYCVDRASETYGHSKRIKDLLPSEREPGRKDKGDGKEQGWKAALYGRTTQFRSTDDSELNP